MKNPQKGNPWENPLLSSLRIPYFSFLEFPPQTDSQKTLKGVQTFEGFEVTRNPKISNSMSALAIGTQIPSNINTVETALAWSGLAFAFLNPTISVLETINNPQRVAQAQIFQAADNTYRLLIRATLPLDPNFISDRTKKLWMFSQEASNVIIPAAYSAN